LIYRCSFSPILGHLDADLSPFLRFFRHIDVAQPCKHAMTVFSPHPPRKAGGCRDARSCVHLLSSCGRNMPSGSRSHFQNMDSCMFMLITHILLSFPQGTVVPRCESEHPRQITSIRKDSQLPGVPMLRDCAVESVASRRPSSLVLNRYFPTVFRFRSQLFENWNCISRNSNLITKLFLFNETRG